MKKLRTILLFVLIFACGLVIAKAQIASAQDSAFDPEQRLKELGIKLRTPPTPVANYVVAVRTGNLVFLAGHGPRKPEGG